MVEIKREGIILETTDNEFENQAVLNPTCFQEGNTVHMFYRAVKQGNFSSIGYCKLEGPLKVVERSDKPILYPEFDIRNESFETMFFEDKMHVGLTKLPYQFDLVIGNPPYRDYVSEYAPLGEKEATKAFTFDQYFLIRGIDVLKPGGILIFIIPNTFLYY